MLMFTVFSLWCEVATLHLHEPKQHDAGDIIDELLRMFALVRRIVSLWASCLHLIRQAEIAGLLLRPGRTDGDARVASHVYTALSTLEDLNESTTVDIGDKEVYKVVIKRLSQLAETVVTQPDDWSHVMRWGNVIPERFLQLLKAQEQLALVVLAHYCVIVHHSQKWWCMKGWSEKVFDAVVRTLHEDWQPNLDWAVQGMRSPNLFIKDCLIE
jgi:hypothetical protein